MKKQTITLLTTFLCAAAAAAGCSTATSTAKDGGSGTGGASGGGGSGGNLTGVALVPNETGFVPADSNDLGIVGSWYTYGDGIGSTGAPPGDCQGAGHTDAECSKIDSPAAGSFPNTGGKMCTSGTVAKVIDMVGKPGMPDYGKIWGAGIGLDLNNPGGAAVKAPFLAAMKGTKGIEFEIDAVPLAKLRVEVEATSTNGGADGNDYWGANSTYPPSPVIAGKNQVLWEQFVGPKGHKFMPDELLGIQFHVPTGTSAAGAYSFCISNLKILK